MTDGGINGTDILVLIGGHVVGSQRGVTFDETAAEIDVSSKTTRSGRYLSGRYGSTVTLDALYAPTDNGQMEIKAAIRAGTPVVLVRQEDGSGVEEADAIITSLSEAGPDQAEATFSASFRVDGDWREVTT